MNYNYSLQINGKSTLKGECNIKEILGIILFSGMLANEDLCAGNIREDNIGKKRLFLTISSDPHSFFYFKDNGQNSFSGGKYKFEDFLSLDDHIDENKFYENLDFRLNRDKKIPCKFEFEER